MNKKKVAEILSSNLGLLVLGFILTTVCGGLINWGYSKSTFEREKRFELLKAELLKHDELLSQLTNGLGERTFRLQRVLWLLDPPNTTPVPETWQITTEQKEELKTRWDDYYKTVADWNIHYRAYAIKVRVLAGDDIANEFIDRDVVSGARKAKAGTLCGVVEDTHGAVAAMRAKAKDTLQVNRVEHEAAQRKIDHLYDVGETFFQDLYEALRKKVRSDNPTGD